jgi:hypothetical protein
MPRRTDAPEILAAAAELRRLDRARAQLSATGIGRLGTRCGCAPTPIPGGFTTPRPEPVFGVDPPCEAYPLGEHRTNDNFIFLREILQGVATPEDAGNCLVTWLTNTINYQGQPFGMANEPMGAQGIGVLVIDQPVLLTQPITVPARMILTGVGINGAGALRFDFAGSPGPAIIPQVLGPEIPSYLSIQDLVIEYVGENAPGAGIAINHVGDLLYLRRLALRNWNVAILNNTGYSVYIEQCTFDGGNRHIEIGPQATALRARECVFRGATGPAIYLNPPNPNGDPPTPVDGNTALITSCVFSDNDWGIYVDRHQAATMIGNSFRGNVSGGIYVTSNAREARIIGNSFDQGDRFTFEDVDLQVRVVDHHHQYGFNTVADPVDPVDTDAHESLVVERIYAAQIQDLA